MSAHDRWKPKTAEDLEESSDPSVRAILRGAGALKDEACRAAAGVDWEALSERIAGRAIDRKRAALAGAPRSGRSGWGVRWRPAFAGALIGLVAGAAGVYFMLRPYPPAGPPPAEFRASGEFIDRVEAALARRETLDYLAKSRALLLDFVQAPPEEAAGLFRAGPAFRRTEDLLATKRLLNLRLDSGPMAKAREICNQIEKLFVELALISGEISVVEAQRIQRLVEDRQLLLRIRLLQKEIEESEV